VRKLEWRFFFVFVAERDFDERKKNTSEKKKGKKKCPRSKKKQRKFSLSLFSSFFEKHIHTNKYVRCAFDRFLFCNFLSLSLSLSPGARAFLRSFLSEKQLCASFRAYQKWISSLFFFVFASKCVVCRRIVYLFFCVSATPARARVSFVLFDDDDARVTIQLAPPESWCMCTQDDLAAANVNRHIIFIHITIFLLMENRRKHPSYWRRQAHVENRSDFVQH